MDWSAIISEIGGGLPAVVIVGLAVALWMERKRNDTLTQALTDVQNARVEDQKQNQTDMVATVRRLAMWLAVSLWRWN